jgi:hypothetical protein
MKPPLALGCAVTFCPLRKPVKQRSGFGRAACHFSNTPSATSPTNEFGAFPDDLANCSRPGSEPRTRSKNTGSSETSSREFLGPAQAPIRESVGCVVDIVCSAADLVRGPRCSD